MRILAGRKLIVVLAGAILAACAGPAPAPTHTPDLAILDVTVIDAVGGFQPGMDVHVTNGVITQVAPMSSLPLDAAQTIDGKGKFLIPGLWDMHVHLTYTDGLDHETFFPLAMAHGVTSLRDTGGHLDKMSAAIAQSGTSVTPDLYVSGPLMDGPARVYDGHSASFPDLSIGVASAEEARAAVDDLAAQGVHFIKAYEMLAPDVFAAIVEQAGSHGLPVSAHIPLSMTPVEAIAAGAKDMQHLRNLEFGCVADPVAERDARRDTLAAAGTVEAAALRREIHSDQRPGAIAAQSAGACTELISALADNQVFQTPTLTITRFLTHGLHGDPRYRKTYDLVPAGIAEGWKSRSEQLAGIVPDATATAYDTWVTDMIGALSDAGVPILAGTDAPIGFLTPGASLHEELSLLVGAGLTPEEALASATYAPALFFGLQGERGTVAEGMAADLVLLESDPLAYIENVGSIHAVIKDGEVLDRAALDDMLAAPNRN